MADDLTQSDTARTPSIEPDQTWPETVELRLHWRLESGRLMTTSHTITANEFFGRGTIGAPMDGNAMIGQLERLRKAGPPAEPHRQMKREGKDLTRK